jgi:uncharacterized protein
MKEKIRGQIEEYAKSFQWTPEDYYWQHTLQVREFALMIQKRVGGDKDVVEVAALLHDIGKAELRAPGHEAISAQKATLFLKQIGFDENKAQKVAGCIRYENFEPIEARILRATDSMSLIMDSSSGRDWYFEHILQNDRERILRELTTSYQEIEFDFARDLVEKNYKRLVENTANNRWRSRRGKTSCQNN